MDNLAKAAYEAYGKSVDFKNYQGLPMPAWEDLTPAIQNAWNAATQFIINQVLETSWAPPSPTNWLEAFDERAQKEIKFAGIYATDFKHGTDGHNRLLIIHQMANLLDANHAHALPHDLK